MKSSYLGRIAPTPTGHLHLGHAATFWTAFRRSREAGGRVILRMEDLDARRCRAEFVQAAVEDLRWLGIEWEGEPVFQSARRDVYLAAWRRLRDGGWIYPCKRSRRDVAASTTAPHEEEPLFPPEWRPGPESGRTAESPEGTNWRFRVPDGRRIRFHDGNLGAIERIALRDFGDFVIWNRDNVPAYELAVVVDDAQITEVVRGADLLTSTARQILLHEALGQNVPRWFHCPLICDADGRRLAKRTAGLGLRELRARGCQPGDLLKELASLTGGRDGGGACRGLRARLPV